MTQRFWWIWIAANLAWLIAVPWILLSIVDVSPRENDDDESMRLLLLLSKGRMITVAEAIELVNVRGVRWLLATDDARTRVSVVASCQVTGRENSCNSAALPDSVVCHQ